MEQKPQYTANQPQPRLLEISEQLGRIYSNMCRTEIDLAHQREDLEGRQMYLAPIDGWPGKNQAERDLAQARAFAADELCTSLKALIRENEGQLAELQAQAQGPEAERRAMEWMIRERMVQALRGEHIDSNGSGPIEDASFDDVMQAKLDQKLTTRLKLDLSPSAGLDIPF